VIEDSSITTSTVGTAQDEGQAIITEQFRESDEILASLNSMDMSSVLDDN
jgi:hypothetical protein